MRCRTWSGTLRELLQMACAEECENISGALEAARASSIVGTETCDRSTIMPSRFISLTTSCSIKMGIYWDFTNYMVFGATLTLPNCERPPMCGYFPGSSTLQQSALKNS